METRPIDATTSKNVTSFCVSGKVKETRIFNLQELLGMDTIEVSDLLLACGSGEPKGRLNSCRGILLTDIIHLAEVTTSAHNDTKKMFVIASSDDGYTTVFSWQELFNTAVGEGVMIILEKDSRPVYKERGNVDLFSAKDFLTGPRYVKRLSEIRIAMVE
jgi:hypothetical protein